jgi:hypothetical protein
MPPILREDGEVDDLSYIQGIQVDYDQEEDLDEYLEEERKEQPG